MCFSDIWTDHLFLTAMSYSADSSHLSLSLPHSSPLSLLHGLSLSLLQSLSFGLRLCLLHGLPQGLSLI